MEEKQYAEIMRVLKRATKGLADLVDILQGPGLSAQSLTDDEEKKLQLQLMKLGIVMKRLKDVVYGGSNGERAEK